jgi:hypothetical protein
MRSSTRAAAALSLVLAAGCKVGEPADPLAPPPPPEPKIVASAVSASSTNVLSAIVTAWVQHADSVAVRFGPAGQPLDSATPAATLSGDSIALPVFGLLPDTGYTLLVIAHGGDQVVRGDTLEFTTGTLPDDLPQYVAGGPDPSPGYVVFAAGLYGLALDNGGRVVWYHRFPDGIGLNFQAQPTGQYVACPPTTSPTDPGAWIVLDPLGTVVRTLTCADRLRSRLHDLILEPDGSYWLLCDATRIMDLSAGGGVVDARVTGTVVQHVSGTGALLFQWSPFDHFDVMDLDPADRAGPNVNWTHGNALELDQDGNLLVSFRNLNEITKIDTRAGAVIWRMGGSRNEFSFLDAPAPAFARQHGLRSAGPGQLLLLDNLGNPAGSRAERYAYDEDGRIARLIGSYGPTPAVTATLGGTTQYLPDGRTLVSFGTAGRVEEYDASGRVVWQIEGNPGYVFRAQRISSLYRPAVDSPR